MKYDQTVHPQNLSFTEEDLIKAIGSRGGQVIGQTRSGKPIYARSQHPHHADFSHEDHYDAKAIHHHAMHHKGDKSVARKENMEDHDSNIRSGHPLASKTANTKEALSAHAAKLLSPKKPS